MPSNLKCTANPKSPGKPGVSDVQRTAKGLRHPRILRGRRISRGLCRRANPKSLRRDVLRWAVLGPHCNTMQNTTVYRNTIQDNAMKHHTTAGESGMNACVAWLASGFRVWGPQQNIWETPFPMFGLSLLLFLHRRLFLRGCLSWPFSWGLAFDRQGGLGVLGPKGRSSTMLCRIRTEPPMRRQTSRNPIGQQAFI